MKQQVLLPKRQNHKTPRLLMADAYTIGSNEFESEKAKEKSTYYITFRKLLHTINPNLYDKGDDRLGLYGLAKITDYLFYEPITHEEIDETKRYLEHALVSSNGITNYSFPEELWRDVVDNYNGRPPIEIKAIREGSVFYPNEPVIQITSKVKGMGVLAAWFESKLLQVWSMTEMVTQLRHWFNKLYKMVDKVYGNSKSKADKEFLAGLMLQNFGDRAGICPQESEWLGEAYLMVFAGTDTFAGGYQAWKNSNETPGLSYSIKALAHRNVQSYELQKECFRALYEHLGVGESGSFVADCYSYYDAVEKDLLELALEAKKEGNGKVIVARPDSGNALEQVTWLCRLALKHGLYEEVEINGKTWRFATNLKFIEGDGMRWETMIQIMDAMMEQGFFPPAWGLFGVGGGLRNKLSRDNTSAKYALNSIGEDNIPVCKFSEEIGKTTLPGPFKLRREKKYLDTKETIAFDFEEGIDALEVYYDGSNIYNPFLVSDTYQCPQDELFTVKQQRLKEQFDTMPLTLVSEENNNYPTSKAVREKRIELLKKYAPKKLPQNY